MGGRPREALERGRAEGAERRAGQEAGQLKRNAALAREFMFSFPVEMSQAGRFRVAETIARHLADTHGIAADFAIHKPGREGDQRNFHCHMLTTTRRMTAHGLGAKVREWADLKSGAALARDFRAFAASTMNAVLAEEGKATAVHVEHRSFKARGERPKGHPASGRRPHQCRAREEAHHPRRMGARRPQRPARAPREGTGRAQSEAGPRACRQGRRPGRAGTEGRRRDPRRAGEGAGGGRSAHGPEAAFRKATGRARPTSSTGRRAPRSEPIRPTRISPP